MLHHRHISHNPPEEVFKAVRSRVHQPVGRSRGSREGTFDALGGNEIFYKKMES